MRTFSLFGIFLAAFFCISWHTVIPKRYEIIAEKTGDLDHDGVAEKVTVYNTLDSTDGGFIRELRICKRKSTKWVVWKSSRKAVLKSKEGGMMGDPFGEIDIKNGVLSISENGGTSWKWGYTNKYRLQNQKFELIGYSAQFGKLCENWTEIDYNLMTGKIIIKKQYESCLDDESQQIYKRENEIFYHKGLKLSLDNRTIRDFKITSPKYKHEFYL